MPNILKACAPVLLLLWVVLLLSGCAYREQRLPLPKDSMGIASPVVADGWIYRHKVHLTVGKRLFSFNGVMELSADRRLARVVALGGVTTLFDITVTQGAYWVRSVNPALKRIPHLEAYVAMTVHTMYLGQTPEALGSLTADGVAGPAVYIDPEGKFQVRIHTVTAKPKGTP